MTDENASALVGRLAAGDRQALAKAITLVESSHPADRRRADELLDGLPVRSDTWRIGVTGAPGVGKSTFIDAFGTLLVERGKRVAVLTVDPTSPRSGGSILADKTRMARLSRSDRAFVRPSPTGEHRGGVARATPDVARLCEAAGFDVVIVETVGVGQIEFAVRRVVDFLVLLVSGAGDDLQAVKRGMLELVDCVAVSKADGERVPAAEREANDYRTALAIVRGRDAPPVLLISAVEQRGLDLVLDAATDHNRRGSAESSVRRGAELETWFKECLGDALAARYLSATETAETFARVLAEVRAGNMTPERAVRDVLARHPPLSAERLDEI